MEEKEICRSYLAEHKIEPTVNEALDYCLKMQPAEPFKVLSELMREKASVTAGVEGVSFNELFSPAGGNDFTCFGIRITSTAGEIITQLAVDGVVDQETSFAKEFESVAKSLHGVDPSDQQLLDDKILGWKKSLATGDMEKYGVLEQFCFPLSWCCFKTNLAIQNLPVAKGVSAICGVKRLKMPRIIANLIEPEVGLAIKAFQVSVEGAECFLQEARFLHALCIEFRTLYKENEQERSLAGDVDDKESRNEEEEEYKYEHVSDATAEFVEDVMKAFTKAAKTLNLPEELSFNLILEFPDCGYAEEAEDPDQARDYKYSVNEGATSLTSAEWAVIVRRVVACVQSLEPDHQLTGLVNPVQVTDTAGLAYVEEGTSEEMEVPDEDVGGEVPIEFPQLQGMKLYFSTSKREHLADIIAEGDVENIVINWKSCDSVSVFASDLNGLRNANISLSFNGENTKDASLMSLAVGAGCDEVFVGDINECSAAENINELIRLKASMGTKLKFQSEASL